MPLMSLVFLIFSASTYLDTKNETIGREGVALSHAPFWLKKNGRPSVVQNAAFDIVMKGFNPVND